MLSPSGMWKRKMLFFDTLGKWSPGCVESVRSRERAQNHFIRHRQTPRTLQKWWFLMYCTVSQLWESAKCAKRKWSPKIQENRFFKKKKIFLVQLIKTKLFCLRSFVHTARKKFLSEKIECSLWKKHEKWWNFTNFSTSTRKKILNKNWNFFETGENHQECITRCYKAIQVCFYTFLTTVLAGFHRFELNPYFERLEMSSFFKKDMKVRKTTKIKIRHEPIAKALADDATSKFCHGLKRSILMGVFFL